MGKHEKFEHKDVKGETDPRKIKAETERIERENQAEMDRIRRLQRGK